MRIFKGKRSTIYVWRNIQLVRSRLIIFMILFLFSVILFALDKYLYASVGLIIIPISWVLGAYTYRSYLIWKSGLEGETIVSKTLEKLPDGYILINGVTVPGNRGDIDHVVVGPNGIFIVESKNYGGRISCEKDKWKKIRIKRGKKVEGYIGSPSNQAKRNAKVLKDHILQRSNLVFDGNVPHIWIHAILVFTNPRVTLEAMNPTVDIVELENLVEFILKKKSELNLTDPQIDNMGSLLARS